jgi:hypothetical protein
VTKAAGSIDQHQRAWPDGRNAVLLRLGKMARDDSQESEYLVPRSSGSAPDVLDHPDHLDEARMNIEVWDTRTIMEPSFANAWQKRLRATAHVNFTMSADYLGWQALHGEPSRAVLLEDGTRRGALVLRESGRELVCGFPCRWQMVLESEEATTPEGITPSDAAWFYEGAQRLAGKNRLRFYAPHRIGSGCEYLAGNTVLIDLAHATERELFDRMNHSKRRWTRKSIREGYEVSDDLSLERQRNFARIVNDTHVRRHHLKAVPVADAPGPGEDWRTWEQAWHWLLVVLKDGVVVAGIGTGRYPGGAVDARASGSTEEALRHGANCLVQWEAILRARRAGHRWINFGGATIFKREFGGRVVPLYCGLGGGVQWLAPNLVEKWGRNGMGLRGILHRARAMTRTTKPTHP